MNLRLRFTLAFVLVVLVAILSVVVLVRLDTGVQVREYMMRGGMIGAEGLITRLEDYYRSHDSWQGVESLFMPGGGDDGRGARRPGNDVRPFSNCRAWRTSAV